MPSEWLATYRLQLRPEFGFDDAREIAGYLADLGISHVYLSPILQAASGSSHGYDVVDPTRVSRDLGGESAYLAFSERLQELGLGQLIDIVPNHMSIAGAENPWWWDLLENGIASKYLAYFDVDWRWGGAGAFERIVLPVLEDRYGKELRSGAITLHKGEAGFVIRYGDFSFPVSPRSYGRLLIEAAGRTGNKELRFLGESFRDLPEFYGRDTLDGDRKQVLWSIFSRFYREHEETPPAVGSVIEQVNADPLRLHDLLEQQHYRLASWRMADEALSYRRFFDINTLVGIRVENEQVMQDCHAVLFRFMERRFVDGLRVDHIDGLRDPRLYLERLRERTGDGRIFVEKILASHETLHQAWPVEGSTGYDFLNVLNGLFVDSDNEGPLSLIYEDLTGETTDFDALVLEKKRLVLNDLFASDFADLTNLLHTICESGIDTRDWPRREIEAALTEYVAGLPVYRTYVQPQRGEIDPADSEIISRTIEDARRRLPQVDGEIFDFLERLLSLQHTGNEAGDFVLRLQQLTGPVMAKGVEDTAFYCYNRLVSLNEVGGHPGHFGSSLHQFHAFCAENAARWPRTMLATATHDTKRGEDARMRINALSEAPRLWRETVERWREINQRHHAGSWPDRNMEYFLYQNLVGAWPVDVERARQFAEKAVREAKVHTSWRRPDEAYEGALLGFVGAILNDEAFLAEIEAFVARIARPAWLSSLSQTLIKLTAPGVPDIYQGCELWDHSLVDPDNRRPVDYRLRRELLQRAVVAGRREVLADLASGLPKIWLTRRVLAARRDRRQTFAEGAYRPLFAEGARARHVIAFQRGEEAISVASRLHLELDGDWGDTSLALPPGAWCNVLGEDPHETIEGGTSLRLAELLAGFTAALLLKEPSA